MLILKNEKLNSYGRIGYFVLGIDFIFFLFFAFSVKQGYEKVLWIVFSVMILLFSFFDYSMRKKKVKKKINISIAYCLLVLLWIPVSVWLAIIHLLLLILDTAINRSLVACFNKDVIVYPSFPQKKIQWDTIENIILKDNLLTIDLKNNHLLQAEIDTTEKQINETAFNHYCEQQLNLTN